MNGAELRSRLRGESDGIEGSGENAPDFVAGRLSRRGSALLAEAVRSIVTSRPTDLMVRIVESLNVVSEK